MHPQHRMGVVEDMTLRLYIRWLSVCVRMEVLGKQVTKRSSDDDDDDDHDKMQGR